MAYSIDKDTCIGCGTCESECPVSAISAGDDGKYCIDPELCVERGPRAGGCPVDARHA